MEIEIITDSIELFHLLSKFRLNRLPSHVLQGMLKTYISANAQCFLQVNSIKPTSPFQLKKRFKEFYWSFYNGKMTEEFQKESAL